VTIAAGFVCGDGVLLCASTRETYGAGYVRLPLEKIRTLEDPDCALAITGTGNTALLEMATERILERLKDKSPHNLNRAKKIIVATLLKLHKNQLRYFPGPSSATLLKLLIAIRPRSGPCALLHAEGTTLHEVSSRLILGEPSLEPFAGALHHPALSLRQTVLIALHTLQLAKRISAAAASETHLVALKNDGKLVYQQLDENVAIERALDMAQGAYRDLLLMCADATLSEEEFRAELRRLSDNVSLIRADCVRAEADFRALSGETSSRP